jgi:hypothetical protein
MPVKHARSRSGGRSPFGRGRWGGSRGSTRAHSASETRGVAIPRHPCKTRLSARRLASAPGA